MKPHIRVNPWYIILGYRSVNPGRAKWECRGEVTATWTVTELGNTPKAAYDKWLARAEMCRRELMVKIA